MSRCFLLLGTNLGDKSQNLLTANEQIVSKIGNLISISSIYHTSAWGKEDQGDFLNQVLAINTSLTPSEVLSFCLNIEKEMGRVRFEKWGERLIDIDILYYDQQTIKEKNLIVPHQELQNRKFTLVPLIEIAPDFIHPIYNKTNQELLETCDDSLEVRVYQQNS